MARTVHQELDLYLNFSEEDSELVIYLNGITGLPQRVADGQPCPIYIDLFLLHKVTTREVPLREVKRTEIKKDVHKTVFRQRFKYEEMSEYELKNSVLYVEVQEDTGTFFQKLELKGEAYLPLAQVQFEQNEAKIFLQLDIPMSKFRQILIEPSSSKALNLPSPKSYSGSNTLPRPLMKQQHDFPELNICLLFDEKAALLTVKIVKAMKLPNRFNGEAVDSYVRLYFVPKVSEMLHRRTSRTNIIRGDCEPVYNETVHYETMTMDELINSILHVEVLDIPDPTGFGKHTVLGQTDLPLVQVQFIEGEASMMVPLKPPPIGEDRGTILVSLTFTPESKRLSVTLVRATDLNKGETRATDAQAKISITLNGDKVLGKLKTKKKAQSCSPTFNETLNCIVEPLQVQNAAVTIAVFNENRSAHASKRNLGQVILCEQSTGDEYRHWSDVMASLGNPIEEWHNLK